MRTRLPSGTMSDLWTHQDQEFLLVIMSLFSQPVRHFSVIYATLKQPLSTHTKTKQQQSKTGLKQQFMIFHYAMGRLGWPCLGHLYGCGQPKPQVDGPRWLTFMLSGPSFGMSGMAGILSLSLHEIYHWRLSPCWEKHYQREKAKNKVSGGQDQKFLSFFGHILIKQNTRPE